MALVEDVTAPAGAPGSSWLTTVDYDRLNRDQVLAALPGLDLSELQQVADRERAGRNRVTVLRRLETLITRQTGEAPTGAATTTGTAYPTANGQVVYDSRVFRVPPGWPVPPEGWAPPAGWKPDPSWPPAPADWVFWRDREAGEAAPIAPAGVPPTTVPMSFPLPPGAAAGPKKSKRKGIIIGVIVLVLVTVGIIAAAASGSSGGTTGGSFSASSSQPGFLDPDTLASDLQTQMNADLNDPSSDIYNDPDSDIYEPGETMGPISCIRLMPASNDQFSCMGTFSDGTTWSKSVQVSSDGSTYQTFGGS